MERRDFLIKLGLGAVAASAAVAVGMREAMAVAGAVQQSPLAAADVEPAVATSDDLENIELQNVQFGVRRRRRRLLLIRPRRRRVFIVRRRPRRRFY